MREPEIPDASFKQKACGHKFGAAATYEEKHPYTSWTRVCPAAGILAG